MARFESSGDDAREREGGAELLEDSGELSRHVVAIRRLLDRLRFDSEKQHADYLRVCRRLEVVERESIEASRLVRLSADMVNAERERTDQLVRVVEHQREQLTELRTLVAELCKGPKGATVH